MIQPENFQPSWLYFDNIMSPSGIGHSELFSPLPAQEYTPESSFSFLYLENMASDESMDFQVHAHELNASLPLDDSSQDFEELNAILNGEIIDLSGFLDEKEGIFPSQPPLLEEAEKWSLGRSMHANGTSIDMSYVPPVQPVVPTEEMEFDNQLIIVNLFMAYGEAMENEQRELAEVIVKRIRERVNPVGDLMERVLYYLFQSHDKQSEYLKQESVKNFLTAFKAFYQIFPYGKFAHLAANSAILEAMPSNAEIIHIFDFDIGDGIQWSSMIEAIGREQRELRLTAIKWSKGDSWRDPCDWNFEETKRRLYDHARAFGQKLKLDELELRDLSQIKNMKRRGDEREWFAFNCMVNIPHMGRVRSQKDVAEFLRVAKEFVSNATSCNSVITFGDGEASEKFIGSTSFGSFLDGNMIHYKALLESMECNFPINLEEARTAMECLFVAPFVSSLAWIRRWEEKKECRDLRLRFALKGWRVSKESVIEAKVMVREGESLYGVRVEGDHKNEMILEWRNTPLVRVSSWRSEGRKIQQETIGIRNRMS